MMKRSNAVRLVALLAATGHGWTDLHVESYTAEFARGMADDDAAEEAVRNVIREWTKPIRVPIGVVLSEYRREVERRALARPALPPSGAIPIQEGIAIAKRAYAEEQARRGRIPDSRHFERWAQG
jgi:hypothetical protein